MNRKYSNYQRRENFIWAEITGEKKIRGGGLVLNKKKRIRKDERSPRAAITFAQ